MLHSKADRSGRSRWAMVMPVMVVTAMIGSCASVGTLGGGDYDEAPPRLLGASPALGETNVATKKFSIEFDEYIKLDKPGEKVVFSPPQVQQPEVKARGKRVVVTLQDTLIPQSTYTIDFSDAIQDNNEGNPLESFVYTFSTGSRIDSMEVGGTVLNASNLEPVKGMLVGLHSNLSDSAFLKQPFDRVGRTDSRGKFSIRGVAPGRYRLFGLADADNNYAYTQPAEALAFCDSVIVPRSEPAVRQDTAWIDSLTIDSIVERGYTRYLPDDIILRSFVRNVKDQRLAKSERTTKKDFTLYFTAPADTLPTIEGLNFDATDAFVVERLTDRIDTLKYWIKDSLIYAIDTLMMRVSYLHTDSLKRLMPHADTLRLASKEKPKTEKELERERKAKEKELERKRERGEKIVPEVVHLGMELYVPRELDVYDYLSLLFKEPVNAIDTAGIHLVQKVDTLWQDVPFDFLRDSIDIMTYSLFADWKPGETYALEVDSAAVVGIYGLSNNKARNEFKVKTLDSYGQVFFNVTGVEGPAFVELLDTKDKVVRMVKVTGGRADFYYLTPGKYAARLVEDTNNNGVWDTGDYERLLQPEMVYYYPQMIEFKANFDILQDWNIHSKPLDKQKPEEVTQQKPDRKVERKRNDDRNRNNANTRRSTPMGF